MGEKKLSTKTIVAIGIGTAVFVILGRFVVIPTGVPNTTIETSYAFLALMALLYGPVAGGLIGFIGHALKDAIFYGSPWWSWVLVSAFIGFLFGLAFKKINIEEGEFGVKQIVRFNIAQVIIQAIGWPLIAPILDIVIYAEPANKVFLQGIVSGGLNMLSVGILGTLLVTVYAKSRTKSGSLHRE